MARNCVERVIVAGDRAVAETDSVTFDYTGADQTWTVPTHEPGTLKVLVAGGGGGDYNVDSGALTNRGGIGGYIRGALDVAAGTTLTIGVGGKGDDGETTYTRLAEGGGGPRPGGNGGLYGNHSTDEVSRGGAGGGGGSEVKIGSTVIAVAGGGGGGAIKAGINSGERAGDGASQTGSGADATPATATDTRGQGGFGGTTSAAGAGGASATDKYPTLAEAGHDGSGGTGGDGASYIYDSGSSLGVAGGGGGGGGGYYGAGGGGAAGASTFAGRGGGGSSWSSSSYVSEDETTDANPPVDNVAGYVTFEWELPSAIVMTSPDGLTWTEVPSWPGSSASEVSVAGNTYFVATAAAATADNYAYSTDGDNWTLESSSPTMSCVAWTGTYFVNLASNVSYRATDRAGTWSGPTSTGSSSGQVGRRLIYNAGLLVGAIQAGASQPSIVTSTDEGASWTAIDSADPLRLYDMDYGAGRYVAVIFRPGSNLDQWVATSTDGTTWTRVSTGTNNEFPYCVRYGNGQFVALGINNSSQTRTYTSTDGLSWTVNTPTGLPTSTIFSNSEMVFWKGRWIWVNPLMNSIYTSTDGVNWSGTAFADRDWRGLGAGVACLRFGIYRDGRVHLS
jgi:hypothetical protein